MLDERYGKPRSLSLLELKLADVKCKDHTLTEGGALRGTYLSKTMKTLGNAHCQIEAQVVEVNDGFTDLYVEH